MNIKRIVFPVSILLLTTLCIARAPKVIKMFPENGAVDVPPGPIKIRILFDQDMDKGYSLCGGGEDYPDMIGKPKWTSRRALVFSARLKPNHNYSFGINCPSAQNFKSVRGEPAEILIVQFRTAGIDGSHSAISEQERSSNWKCFALLDEHTQTRLNDFEQVIFESHPYPQEYKNASGSQKRMIEKEWIEDVNSLDHNADSAAAYLGMVKSQSAVGTLEKILSDPPRSGKIKSACTRSLGQIGEKSSIPILIDLLDDVNANTRVYARVSLAEITGVYFGDDKEKWTAWYKDPSSVTYTKSENVISTGSNQEAFDTLQEAINNKYSYKDEKDVDWDRLFQKYKNTLLNAGSPMEFAKTAGLLLAHAKDKHIWLNVNGEHVSAYRDSVIPNVNVKLLPDLVPHFKKHNANVSTGRFGSGIGYIYIDSWSRQNEQDFDELYIALNQFSNAPRLIIDVRANNGGAEPLAQKFAGCFVDEPKLYAKHVTINPKSPNGFYDPSERILEPNKGRPQYRGRVAVLSGPVVMSSCEAFVLMMKQVPNCTIIGEPTRGSSGNPKPHDLGNGVIVYLPSWKAMLPDGTCFEGKGIQPDIPVRFNYKASGTKDPVIEAALNVLRNKR